MGGTLDSFLRRNAGEQSEGQLEEDRTEITHDEVFHLLRNRRRRYALHYLRSVEGPVELGELAEQIAAWENGVDPIEITSDQRKRVYNSLQQTHLPRMDDAGVVDYESRRGRITLTENAECVDIYFEYVSDRDIPWSQYYLAFGTGSCGVVAAAWSGLFPFTLLPNIAWAAFIAVVFTFSALANLYFQKQNRLGTNTVPPEVGEV